MPVANRVRSSSSEHKVKLLNEIIIITMISRPRYIKHTNFIIDFIDIELFNIDLLRTYRAYIDLTNNIDQSVVGIRRLISFQNLYFMMMM